MALPPPHPACRTRIAMKRLPSSQRLLLRFFGLPAARPVPIRAIGIGRKTAYKELEGWPSADGISCAACVGAVIVSVEVTEFAPGVTDVDDREQVASGVEPVTAQES